MRRLNKCRGSDSREQRLKVSTDRDTDRQKGTAASFSETTFNVVFSMQELHGNMFFIG